MNLEINGLGVLCVTRDRTKLIQNSWLYKLEYLDLKFTFPSLILLDMLRTVLLLSLVTLAHSRSSNYNYFDFVRQWSPGMCYKRGYNCKDFPDHIDGWTIHGLWPSEDAWNYPSDCASRCWLSTNTIRDLTNELHDEWPTAFGGGDTKFWAHEFCKHGTCCKDVYPSIRDYFSAGLSLHSALSLDDALAKANIHPSETKTFTFTQLDSALAAAFGDFRQSYWCRTIKEGSKSKQLLYQVSTCLDKHEKVVDCPIGKSHYCDRSHPLYLLPWSLID